MAIRLEGDDFRRLVRVVQGLPAFAQFERRRALVLNALQGTPRAERRNRDGRHRG